MRLLKSVRLHLAGDSTAVAGVALTTGVIHAIPGADQITNISLPYLLIVMATAYRFGSTLPPTAAVAVSATPEKW